MNKQQFLSKIYSTKKDESFFTVFNQFVFYLFATRSEENFLVEKNEVSEFSKFVKNFDINNKVLLKYYVQIFQSENNNDKFVENGDELKELIDINKNFEYIENRKIFDFKELFKSKIVKNEIRVTLLNEKNINIDYADRFQKLKGIYSDFYTNMWGKWEKLDKKIFKEICLDKCFYCGITIEEITELSVKLKIFTKRTYSGRGFSLEIDRKNPYGQYLPYNVVLACYWCNNAKTDEFSCKEFQKIGLAMKEMWQERKKRKEIILGEKCED